MSKLAGDIQKLNKKAEPPLRTREAREALEKKIRTELDAFRKKHALTTPRVDEKRLRLDQLYDAVGLTDVLLPDMVIGLYGDFIAEYTSVGDRVRIFEVFSKFGLTHERLTREMGLVKEAINRNGGISVGTLLNIDLTELRNMGAKEITGELVGEEV